VSRVLTYRFKLIVFPEGSWALRLLPPPDVLAVATDPDCDCMSSLWILWISERAALAAEFIAGGSGRRGADGIGLKIG